MLTNNIVAPKPEVQHLPTIFRQISNGLIRIPPFQRGFVWQQKQIIELLESLYNGFPVGSILLWNIDEKVFKTEFLKESSFPIVDERYPVAYVLDGMQRLSSLYGVFFYDSERHKEQFDISFDLISEKFMPSSDKALSADHIKLSALFNPRHLMEAQAKLAQRECGDKLIDKSIRLYSTFQEYLVPTVTINNRDLTSVVKMFERINNTGTKLSTVDFMRASTWSQTFDLTQEIEQITDWLAEAGQILSQDTIVKILAIALGVIPTPENLLNLRNFGDEELHKSVTVARRALEQMISFISNETGILSFEYVAYEAQLLGIATIFVKIMSLTPIQNDILRNWFWEAGFQEGFRGKPDDFVTRCINELVDAVNRTEKSSLFKRSTEVDDYYKRPFQRKAALSSAVAGMFSIRRARNIVTGEVIPSDQYMAEFSIGKYHCIIPQQKMRSVIGGGFYTARIISNIAVSLSAANKDGLISLILSAGDRLGSQVDEVLNSQFIDDECLRHLSNGEFGDFLRKRANNMFKAAETLCGY